MHALPETCADNTIVLLSQCEASNKPKTNPLLFLPLAPSEERWTGPPRRRTNETRRGRKSKAFFPLACRVMIFSTTDRSSSLPTFSPGQEFEKEVNRNLSCVQISVNEASPMDVHVPKLPQTDILERTHHRRLLPAEARSYTLSRGYSG